jgi:hypothetical protein
MSELSAHCETSPLLDKMHFLLLREMVFREANHKLPIKQKPRVAHVQAKTLGTRSRRDAYQ